MELIPHDTRFDFIGKKKITLWISAAAILISIGSIFLHGGLRYGVDFAGGLVAEIKFSKPVDVSEVRSGADAIGLKDAIVQRFGGENEFLIRVEKATADLETMSKSLQTSLQGRFKDNPVEIRRVELVGPKVGKDLKTKAMWAVGLAFLAILIYVAFRFHEFSYGLGGIVALFHDIVVTFGAISIFNIEFSLNILAVILSIIGFSINDTIVIFDRVRENHKTFRKESLENIMNISLNQCLGRTLITSGTVFLTVGSLFLFGGEVINDFAFLMLVGTIEGVYSTVYLSCPVVLFWQKLFPSKKGFRK